MHNYSDISNHIACPVTDAYKEFDKCTIIFGLSDPDNESTGAVVAIDPFWGKLWPYINGKRTVGDIYSVLCSLYPDDDKNEMLLELVSFIEELTIKGMMFLVPNEVTQAYTTSYPNKLKSKNKGSIIHNVLLINPPSGLDLAGKAPVLSNSAPPLGLAYIGASLKMNEYNVKIIDLSLLKSTGHDIDYAANFKPDIVGITATSAQFPWATYIIKKLRDALPEVPIVMGGIHPSLCPNEAFRHGADYVIGREGDHTMPLLLNALNNDKNPTQYEGIWTEDYTNGYSPQILELDGLPFPARELLGDLNKYRHSGGIITSRGCPYKCNWCSSIFRLENGMPLCRRRSPENVIEEIHHITKYGIYDIQFQDDSFTASSAWVRSLLKLIKNSGLNIRWGAQGNINNFVKDKSLGPDMYEAGMRSIFFGIETADPSIFASTKHSSINDAIETLYELNKLEDLNVLASFIIGHTDDSDKSMEATAQLAAQLLEQGIDVQVNVLNPFPGSPVLSDPNLIVDYSEGTLNYFFRKVNISTKTLERHQIVDKFANILYKLACIDDPALAKIVEGIE